VPRTLLLGYGNTLCGDDALGPMAVERLRALLPGAEFISCHQLGPELAETMAVFDFALFLDAACDGEPGTVHVERLSPSSDQAASLTHHVEPAALLELAHALYGRAPLAMLVTGVGESFDNHEGLSAKGNQALEEICRIVPRIVPKPLADLPTME
jgi:hydrogenase maturation protease